MGAISESLVPFATWDDVLMAAKLGAELYYQAPLDVKPTRFTPVTNRSVRVEQTYELRVRTIRIFPPGFVGRGRYRTSDPFTADVEHLPRFRNWGVPR